MPSSVIDLSHPIQSGMPTWPGDPPVTIHELSTIERNGYFVRSLVIGEHSGTHIGVGRHMQMDGLTVESLRADELVRPGVCIDVREECGRDPDLTVEPSHIKEFEKTHGLIPVGAVVLIYTGRSAAWNEPDRYFGYDDSRVMHFPGVSVPCATFLSDERGVMGLGIDTAGIDPGIDNEFNTNKYWLSNSRRFHVENLTNLDQLPPIGFTVAIGALNIVGGSGAPARVFALID